jgi:hypothetical protein
MRNSVNNSGEGLKSEVPTSLDPSHAAIKAEIALIN